MRACVRGIRTPTHRREALCRAASRNGLDSCLGRPLLSCLLSEAIWLRRAVFAVFASLRRLARYSETPMRPAISIRTQHQDHGSLLRCAARCSGIFPKRAGEILRVSAQAFTRTQNGLGLLIIERSGVWMPCHAQVGPGTALIFVSDVAFADIAGQHEDFSCWKEFARLTIAHV